MNKLIDEKVEFFQIFSDVKYIDEREEFYIYSISNKNSVRTIFLFFFDKNLSIKTQEENENCNISFIFAQPPIYTIFSYYLLYLRNSDKYSVIMTYLNVDKEELDLFDSPEIYCSKTNTESENDSAPETYKENDSLTEKESDSISQSNTDLLKTSILKYTTYPMIQTTLLILINLYQ